MSSNSEDILITDNLEGKTGDPLVELNEKASERVSSFIKNDAEFMSTELEIADYSGKELDAFSACKRAIRDNRDADIDRLKKEFSDLKNKRISAYNLFQELAGLTK